jgi:PAS domain S-box-containing protein
VKYVEQAGLRRFGNELVGAIPWGTHLCQFYEIKQDLIDILVPYFAEGLRSNEFCMWVTSKPLEVKEATDALKEAVPNLEDYIRKGQIEIVSYDDFYLVDGKFDSERVLKAWAEKESSALKRGFEGLRLAGKTLWIERDLWKSFVNYEEAVSSVIDEHRIIVVCTYCLTSCSRMDIIDVVRNHDGTLIKKFDKWYLVEDSAKRKAANNALKLSEKKYSALFENMQDGLVIYKVLFDETGRPVDYIFLKINKAFERLTGLKRENTIGKPVTQAFPGIAKDYANWIDVYGEVALTGEAVKFESYVEPLHKWYSVSAYSPERGYFVTAFQDITARKKAERKIKHQNMIQQGVNRILREALSAGSEEALGEVCLAVAEEITDSKFGFIGEINEGMLHDIAISDPGWAACTMYDPKGHHMPPGNFKIYSIYGRVLIDGKGFFTNDLVTHPDSIGLPSGHPSLTSFLGVPLKNDGKTIGMMAVANREGGYSQDEQDLLEALAPSVVEAFMRKRAETALQKSEQALRESQHDLKHAQAVAKTGSWRMNLQRNKLIWSDETYRMFGIPRGRSMTYETFLAAVHPDDREYVNQKWKAALDGEPYDIEHKIIVDGEVRWVREKAELEFKNGVLLGGFGTVQDITELKKIQAKLEEYSKHLEQLVEEKTKKLRDVERLVTIGETAGMVGHDIRNPLQSIEGAVYLAKEELESFPPECHEKKELLEILEIIKDQTHYIDNIVADLQDFARTPTPQLIETNIQDLIIESLSTVKIPESIQVCTIFQETLQQLTVDPTFIKRVTINLIENAVQAMPNGGKITLKLFSNEDAACICVEDTGVGITEEHKPKIFTPLFTTKAKGQGFGLAVCKKLMEAHDGEISFESEEGKGTIFTIKLPFTERTE